MSDSPLLQPLPNFQEGLACPLILPAAPAGLTRNPNLDRLLQQPRLPRTTDSQTPFAGSTASQSPSSDN